MPDIPSTLETARLVLRPFRLDDVDAVFAFATDPEWARFLLVPQPYERRHAEEFLAKQVLADPATDVSWAIEHKGTVIGGIDLRFHHDGRIGEIGYSIAREWWGQGMVTEAARAVINGAFESMSALARLRAWVDARNLASQRVMEKLGMTREGTLRGNAYVRGEAVDQVWFGLLRDEWRR